jgi:hypothetical protein
MHRQTVDGVFSLSLFSFLRVAARVFISVYNYKMLEKKGFLICERESFMLLLCYMNLNGKNIIFNYTY